MDAGAPVIDFHVHVVAREVLERCGNNTVMYGFGARPAPRWSEADAFPSVLKGMFDPALLLADMDKRGIDLSVLSTSTVIQNTAWADAPTQAELERRANDEVARWLSRSDRFIGSFTLPLHDIDAALAELERCTGTYGMRVANLPAAVDGAYLGAPRFRPLWQALNDRGVIALIHPDGVRDPWFQDYGLWNSVGQPIEEAKVLASLILEGVLEDLPGLQIVVSHGGGFLPHYFGRLDRNVHNMPDSVRNISQKPSDYLRRLYFDTCLYDPTVLDALVARVGATRLVLGSDYPIGDADPVGFVRGSSVLDEQEMELVCGGTAAALLGIEVSAAP